MCGDGSGGGGTFNSCLCLLNSNVLYNVVYCSVLLCCHVSLCTSLILFHFKFVHSILHVSVFDNKTTFMLCFKFSIYSTGIFKINA
jgi:hypothetical protein